MRRLLVRFGASLLLGALLAGGGTASARVDADPAVVERLVQYGHMNQASARRIIELVNRGLIENAARGGFKYDRVRERVGRTMFNGPGTTREEYQQRLRYVVGRMRSGLDVALLETLFPSARGSAVECVTDFPVTLPACDALLAAATKRSAALPYTPPDDGNALEQELSRAGASKKVAGDVTVALSSVMLEVGRTLDHDPRRQELLGLLAACPGAVKNREAQVRAWNLGPTVNMSRCIATELARRGGSATIATQILFGMEKDAAQSFLLWGSPAMASQIAAASGGPGVSVDNVLKVARSHYQAGRFLQAAQAYEQAARMDPSSSRALAGVGSASLRGGDASKAVEALKAAVQLSPRNANLYAMLAEGYVAAGAFPQAANAYKQALAIDKNHAQAKSGFARLTTDRNLAEAKSLRSKARQHFMARQFKISLTLYEKAVKLEPTNPAGYAGLGASKLALKDSAGSVAAYKKATDLNPKNSAHWTQLAAAYQASGQGDAAKGALDKALAIDPKNERAKAGLRELSAPKQAVASADNAQEADSLVDSLLADPLLEAGEGGGQAAVAEDAALASIESIEGDAAPAEAKASAIVPAATPAAATPAAAKAEPEAAPTGSDPIADIAAGGAVTAETDGAGGKAMPETPPRDEILSALKPLNSKVAACAPGIHGLVMTNIVFDGKTGAVVDAEVKKSPAKFEGQHQQCIKALLKERVTVSPFQKAQMSVTFPFTI